MAVPVDDVRLTRGPGAVGTDGYMAPEQVARAPRPTRARTCTPPAWSPCSCSPVGHRDRGRAPAVPDGPLRPLLESLVATDPDQRPPSATAALERLRRIDVPLDGPWPVVPDRVGDVPEATGQRWANVVIVASVLVIAACVVADYLMLR